MNELMQQLLPRTSPLTWWLSSVFACGVGLGFFVSDSSAIAQATDVPWECSEYSAEAQARCIKTLLELQQEKIVKLEEELKVQEGTINELQEKMESQEAFARREAQAHKQDSRYLSLPYVPAYAYPYGYGSPYGYALSAPIGIYLQPPWRYPRFYGYGPGLGPGYWGPSGLPFNFRYGGGHRHRHR